MRKLIPQDPAHIGPYRLTHRLGTGGMGQVYLARTPSGIQVVVKVVRPSLLEESRLTEGGTDYRKRFAREAELASRVGGFYTAEVVDSDPDAERPWIAYAYIRGRSLREALQEGPLDPPSLRALAAGLAEGLQAIHGSGLIHRDLKPGNVILAEDGPRIIDFGVARPTHGSSMTGTGHLFGTLPYMSPEQAEGTALSPASDVFALGTVLAHAATGDSPFDATTAPRVLLRLVGPPPVEVLRSLPADLRSLITDCWNHDPERRPVPRRIIDRCVHDGVPRSWPPRHLPPALSSAPAAPADPTVPKNTPSSQRGSPPPPRPFDPPTAPARHGPRRSSLLTLAGAVAALVVGVTVWLVPWTGSGDDGRAPVDNGPDTGAGAEAGAGAGSTEPTASASPAPTPTGTANTLWAGEWAEGEPGEVLGDTGGADLWPLAVSPDGSLVATGIGRDDGVEVHLWETADGTQRAVFDGFGRRVRDLAFNHDGSLLAAAGWDGTVRVWDVEAREEATDPLTAHGDQVRSVAFDAGGDRLATGGADGNVHLWGTADFELLDTFAHEHGVLEAVFSPDGTSLATSSSAGTDTAGVVGRIQLWDVGSGQQVREFPLSLPEGSDNESARALSFDADGDLLAAAGTGGVIHLWDVHDPDEHEVVEVLDERGDDPVRTIIHELAFSSDGTAMATVGGDRTVRVWDVAERAELQRLTDHSAFTRGVGFSPDGATLYSCSDDGTVREWPAPG